MCVCVCVIAGVSNKHSFCAKDIGIVLFAIGVGGFDPAELHAVASVPSCSHVFTLGDFSAIDSILDEIKFSTCRGKDQGQG